MYSVTKFTTNVEIDFIIIQGKYRVKKKGEECAQRRKSEQNTLSHTHTQT